MGKRKDRKHERQKFVLDQLTRGKYSKCNISFFARFLGCSRTTIYKDLEDLQEVLEVTTSKGWENGDVENMAEDLDCFIRGLRIYLNRISEKPSSQEKALRAARVLIRLKEMQLKWKSRLNLIELHQHGILLKKKKPKRPRVSIYVNDSVNDLYLRP